MPELAHRGAAGRDDLHRPVRLSQPGQQRPLLSLHFPRRARRRRERDQRGDEEGRGRRRSPSWRARRPPRSSPKLMAAQSTLFGKTSLIPSPFDPRLMLRIAPAVARAAMESGRRAPADRRFRRLRRSAQPLRLPLRLHHEAAVRQGARGEEDASSIPRARTSACCARRRWCWRSGIAEPVLIGRPEVIARAHQALRPDDPPGRRFRDHRSTQRRSPLSRLCRDLSRRSPGARA